MKITLPPCATTEDLQKCMVVVREILDSKAITVSDEQCQAITLEVMGFLMPKEETIAQKLLRVLLKVI